MRYPIITAVALVALGGAALANREPHLIELPHDDDFAGPELVDHLNDLSNDFGDRLRALSFDVVDLRFDVRRQRARVRLTGPGVSLDGHILIDDGVAHIQHPRINLAIGRGSIELDLPDFDLIPQEWEGQRWIEVMVPIIRGRF